MEKIFSAKTLEEAKALAVQYFAEQGIDEDSIVTEILEQPVKKLFGGFKGEFKIKAIAENEQNDTATTTDSVESVVLEEAKAVQAEEEKTADKPKKGSVNQQLIINYLNKILVELGAKDFQINVIEKEDVTVFDIVGERLGIAIGRRGETLDALQYLAILANNRSGEAYSRISVDCNGYRDKRNETLEALAIRTAKKVLAQGRRITLEPMNPYERRIIHGKVAEVEGVYSNSIGEEPYRKVVISANVPKHRRDNDNSGERNGNRDNRGRHDNRNRNHTPSAGRSYKQSSGFSTSFEREYKRDRSTEPKENIEISQDTVDFEKSTSLYGKIEL